MLRSTLLCAVATTAIASLPAQNCFDPLIGNDLNLTDDDTAQGLSLGFTFTYAGVAYTDICVSSNGYIWFGPTSVGGSDYTPTEGELLSGAPRVCPLWGDFNPAAAGGGHIYYDNATPGMAKVTWAGVFEYGGSNAVEMQVVFDATNNITITYGANPAVNGTLSNDAIIGASPGGGAASNPVSFATRPFVITQDTFAEVIPTNGAPIPYSAFQMVWVATSPGYLVADNVCNLTGLVARFETVGVGCPGLQGPSLYEVFGNNGNTPDLSGLDLSFLPSGGDFLAVPGISATYFNGFSNNLGLGDDQAVAVTLPFAFPYDGGVINTIYVSSNGFVTLGGTNPNSGCCNGSVPTMLAGAPRISAWWGDLNPTQGGGVYADLDAATGEFVVSWDQVPEYFNSPPSSCQIALDPSGLVTIRWANVSSTSHTWIAGFSGGNGAPDPGATDLSAVNGSVISSNIILPLRHTAVAGSTPQVGGTFDVEVSNIAPAPNGNICLLFVSTEIPIPGGIPLDGLGLTGCTAFIVLPELYSAVNVTLGAPTTTFSVVIPAGTSFYGLQLMSQAISDDLTANPFGFSVSNGGRWTLGL